MRICVYCASSPKIPAIYFEHTERLGRALVAAEVEIVYGGGSSGLMGRLGDVVVDAGGKIKGIMPRFMNEVEWAHKRVVDFEFTDSMHERKARFLEGIDGLVTLPGGTGTFEELFEAITLKRLGQFSKPIVILNTGGFYDPLRAMLDRCVEQAFMHPSHLAMWTFVDEPEQVLPALQSAAPWDTEAALRIARNAG